MELRQGYTKAMSQLSQKADSQSLLPQVLESSVQPCGPQHMKDKDLLERVQRRPQRLLGLEQFPYADRLEECGLFSLEMRRLRADPIAVFQYLKGT